MWTDAGSGTDSHSFYVALSLSVNPHMQFNIAAALSHNESHFFFSYFVNGNFPLTECLLIT